MKRKDIQFFLAPMLFLILIGSGGPLWANGRNMERAPEVILQKGDNGKEITLAPGQEVEVQLEALGGAGYWWYVQDLDSRLLEVVSEKTRAASDGRVGGPVLGIWTFRAKEPGSAEIRMAYYRIWEGVGTASEQFRAKVNIR